MLETMEFVLQLGKALMSLKYMLDQHADNKNEIKKLQDFIQYYEDRIRPLPAKVKKDGVRVKTAESDFKKLETVIRDATMKLQGWATDRSFFRLFNSSQRMQNLEHLHTDVKTQVQITLQLFQIGVNLEQVRKQNINKAAAQRAHIDKPKFPDQASPRKPPILKHSVLHKDHQLVAAEHGVLYVISKDPSTGHSNLWVLKDGKQLLSCNNESQRTFQTTSPPFVSSTNTLYLGVKQTDRRPAVLVWKAEQYLDSLHSPRADASWKYTFMTESEGGTFLYCGCSDGAIEVWKRHEEPRKPRFYDRVLLGHSGAIRSLASGRDRTLVSIDMKQSSNVRVWGGLKPVATLDLKRETARDLACTLEKKLYVATKDGSRLWCDLKKKNIAKRPEEVHFSLLRKPDKVSGAKNARSCKLVSGFSETVCFLTHSGHGAFSVEEWCGSEFVSRVDTGLKSVQDWTVSKNGTVYCSSKGTGEIFRWKLQKKEK